MKKSDILKQRYVKVILFLAIILSLYCVVRMIMPKQQYHYNGSISYENGDAVEDILVFDKIPLPMGVYAVQLEYDTDTNMQNRCWITDGTVFTNGLLTNGEHLYKELSGTDFLMWLFEGTEGLQVRVSYSGQGYLKVGNLAIYETNQLWTICLTIIWSITLCVCGFAYFRLYDRTIGLEKEQKTVAFWLFVIILMASVPYLLGSNFPGADLTYHLQRIEGIADGIVSGQFPLRLEPEWLYGHGYANAIFYCGTLLYFPAILRLLGFTVTTSYNIYCMGLNIATALIAYFCFVKIFKNRYIGLICSGLYTLSIFRIYKLVITSAVGEGSAVTFMPLVFYGLYKAFTQNPKEKSYKTTWIPIAIGYAGLMQTHVLSCEITAFLTILVCLLLVKKVFQKETFWELAKGAGGAVLASLWYLIPFLDYYINEDMHIRHVSARTIQDRGLYIPQLLFHWWKLGENAVAGDKGMLHSHALGIGMVLVLGVIVFCILWFGGSFKDEKSSVMRIGKYSAVLGCMLMLMSLNIFPWDKIQGLNGVTAALVSSLQFPNRFLGWGTVFLVAVYGCLLWYFLKGKKQWHYYLGVICVILGITTSGVYLLNHVCLKEQVYYIYNEEGMGFGYISGAEYVVEGTEFETIFYSVPVAGTGVEISNYEKEYLHVEMDCVNTGEQEGYVELPMLHYTGYRAYVQSTGEELSTMKGTNHLVRVVLPAGFRGEVEVKFVPPVLWRASEGITYAWWIFICVVVIRKQVRKWKEKRQRDYA